MVETYPVESVDEREDGSLLSFRDGVAKLEETLAHRLAHLVGNRAVEILGPLGYSREFLAEKWFRDAKITDIYEGTGQINRLVVARQILGYSGKELR